MKRFATILFPCQDSCSSHYFNNNKYDYEVLDYVIVLQCDLLIYFLGWLVTDCVKLAFFSQSGGLYLKSIYDCRFRQTIRTLDKVDFILG